MRPTQAPAFILQLVRPTLPQCPGNINFCTVAPAPIAGIRRLIASSLALGNRTLPREPERARSYAGRVGVKTRGDGRGDPGRRMHRSAGRGAVELFFVDGRSQCGRIHAQLAARSQEAVAARADTLALRRGRCKTRVRYERPMYCTVAGAPQQHNHGQKKTHQPSVSAHVKPKLRPASDCWSPRPGDCGTLFAPLNEAGALRHSLALCLPFPSPQD
ncbi:unnamed protein product [Lota lota]